MRQFRRIGARSNWPSEGGMRCVGGPIGATTGRPLAAQTSRSSIFRIHWPGT